MILETDNFDLGDEEDRLVYFLPPIDRLQQMSAIGWLRISYGHLYTDKKDINLISEKQKIVEQISLVIKNNDIQHAGTYNGISFRNKPKEIGEINREEFYLKYLSEEENKKEISLLMGGKFFRTTKELRAYINEHVIKNW